MKKVLPFCMCLIFFIWACYQDNEDNTLQNDGWDEQLWQKLQQDHSFQVIEEIINAANTIKWIYSLDDLSEDNKVERINKYFEIQNYEFEKNFQILVEKYPQFSYQYYDSLRNRVNDTIDLSFMGSLSRIDVIGDCTRSMDNISAINSIIDNISLRYSDLTGIVIPEFYDLLKNGKVIYIPRSLLEGVKILITYREDMGITNPSCEEATRIAERMRSYGCTLLDLLSYLSVHQYDRFLPYTSPETDPDDLSTWLRDGANFRTVQKGKINNKTYKEAVAFVKKCSDEMAEGVVFLWKDGNKLASERVKGTPYGAEIVTWPPCKINLAIHSHYKGTLPIYSFSDILCVYEWYRDGYINDITNFSFDLETADNNSYSLEFRQGFINWAKTNYNYLHTIDHSYLYLFGINEFTSPLIAEKQFALFLKKYTNGLVKLYKRVGNNYRQIYAE